MSTNNKLKPHVEEEEITLKELLLKIQDFYKEVLKNWILIIIVMVPLIGFFFYQAYTTPLKYDAKLTFMVNENEGGGGGGAMAILSQFGFGGGGGGGGKFNLDKILELSKTRKIIQSALFEKVEINKNTDYLANHIIDIYQLHEKWEESEIGLKDFKFIHDSIPSFRLHENAALKKIHSLIIGSEKKAGIYSTSFTKETGIMTLKISSLSEHLSIHWLDKIYYHLSRYYIDKSIEKQQYTYDVMEQKVDSLRNQLNSSESRLARFQDSHRGLFTKSSSLEESRLQRNLQIVTVMYGESIKNKEIAEFSLKSKTPFIQEIDTPIPPLPPIKQSKIKAILLGGVLGGFIAIGFIVIRKIFRDTMKED